MRVVVVVVALAVVVDVDRLAIEFFVAVALHVAHERALDDGPKHGALLAAHVRELDAQPVSHQVDVVKSGNFAPL